ncbi:MAG: TatD family hydrolase [Psychroflexus sp.]|nr:TatD family hydrolase [Psychroflexus sp.]
MIFTDTHTHLYVDAFKADITDVIDRANAHNINRFFIPAIDSETTEAMYALEKKYPKQVFLMMGLHPTSVKADYESELNHIEEQLDKRDFYAIGEIGIDLYWDSSFLEEQQTAFRHQIKLAKKYKLPIVIHCRNAFDEVFEILEEEKSDDLFGIFHCFTGTYEQALRAIGFNLKLGIGGVLTFKNGKIDRFMSEIDLSHIVLETDSPYLAPSPYRGKRNESAYLIKVAEKLADLYQVSLEEVAKITTENSNQIFGVS